MPAKVYREGDGWHIVIHHKGRREDPRLKPSKPGEKILRRDAEAFAAARIVELESKPGAVELGRMPTLAQFIEARYLEHSRTYRKPSTHEQRKHVLRKLSNFEFRLEKRGAPNRLGERRMDEITLPLVRAYTMARKDSGIKASTINTELRQLGRVLNFAREEGFALAEPAFTELTQHGGRVVKSWTPAQLARILSTCAEVAPRFLPILVTLANTGMRRGEALALEWDHVDYERGIIRIQPSEHWQPKNNKPRDIPINAELKKWLRAIERKSASVFLSEDGTPWKFWPKNTWALVMREARKRELAAAKAEGRDPLLLEGGPHRFRHTYATTFLRQRGEKIKVLALILGHSHQRVTELYCHVHDSDLDEVRELVSISPGVTAAEHKAQTRWIAPARS